MVIDADIDAVFHFTDELEIPFPALLQPTLEELRSKFHYHRASREWDTSPTEAFTLRLGTVLWKNETNIAGSEFTRRLIHVKRLLGYQHAAWLVEHKKEYPALFSLLNSGNMEILFPALVMKGARDRFVPKLSYTRPGWGMIRRHSLDYHFHLSGRIAVAG